MREDSVGVWKRRVTLVEGNLWPYYAAIPAKTTHDAKAGIYNYAVIQGYRDEAPMNSVPAGCVVSTGLKNSDRIIR